MTFPILYLVISFPFYLTRLWQRGELSWNSLWVVWYGYQSHQYFNLCICPFVMASSLTGWQGMFDCLQMHTHHKRGHVLSQPIPSHAQPPGKDNWFSSLIQVTQFIFAATVAISSEFCPFCFVLSKIKKIATFSNFVKCEVQLHCVVNFRRIKQFPLKLLF